MKYFRYKTVVQDYTTLELVVPPTAEKFFYTEGLAGVTVDDAQEFLTQQHPECEVTEVTFAEIESELKSCRLYHDIDDIVKTMIHNKYTLADEIKLIKMGIEHPEYIEYQAFVNSCREIGMNMKIERGLRKA